MNRQPVPPHYADDGTRLTDCCQSYSTFHGAMLCCKACYNEVPDGQGDGSERRPVRGVMGKLDNIRDERTFERFSRGAALLRAIHSLWEQHDTLWRSYRFRIDRPVGTVIEANIHALMSEYDLTFSEWYYWSNIATTVRDRYRTRISQGLPPHD